MIVDQQTYCIVHNKFIVIDNIYLIIPLIKSDANLLEKTFKNLLQSIFILDKNKENFRINIDQINLNAIFNDQSILKCLLLSFLNLLIEFGVDENEM